jgi:hypothetical protein
VKAQAMILGVLVIGLATACGGSNEGAGGGGDGGDAESGIVKVTLDEQNGSGKSGRAELHSGAASVDVTIEIDGPSEQEPIHVHRGTCEAPGEEIVHDVGFTTASLGTGQIFATLPEVATGEYVMDIHSANNDEIVMCGVIPEQ